MSRNRLLFGLVLGISMLLTACQSKTSEPQVESLPIVMPVKEANYNTVEAAYGDFGKELKGNAGRGNISPEFVLTKDLSWETSNARFQEILVRNGDFVKKGDVLAVFDLEADTVALREMELELTRTREAFARGCQQREESIAEAMTDTLQEGLKIEQLKIEELQVEKLKIAYEQYVYQTQKSIANLEEKLEELREAVEVNTLTAPFDGVISWVISYSKGDKVTAGAKLISMYSPDEFYLKAADYVDQLNYNTEITLEAGSKNDRRTYVGRVVSAPDILPDTISQKYLYVKLEPAATLDKLVGSVEFSARTEELKDVLLVKKTAVSSEDGRNFVYLLEDDIVKKRYILTGIGNTEYTWILDGVDAGQMLILD